jgi:hypothetical protein
MFYYIESAQFLVFTKLVYFLFADLFRQLPANKSCHSKIGIVVRVVCLEVILDIFVFRYFFFLLSVFYVQYVSIEGFDPSVSNPIIYQTKQQSNSSQVVIGFRVAHLSESSAILYRYKHNNKSGDAEIDWKLCHNTLY